MIFIKIWEEEEYYKNVRWINNEDLKKAQVEMHLKSLRAIVKIVPK